MQLSLPSVIKNLCSLSNLSRVSTLCWLVVSVLVILPICKQQRMAAPG